MSTLRRSALKQKQNRKKKKKTHTFFLSLLTTLLRPICMHGFDHNHCSRMLCSFPPIIVVQSDCRKIYRDSNYSEMSLVVCNERSIATSQPVQPILSRTWLHGAACWFLRSTAEAGPLTWSHHLDGIGIQIQTNNLCKTILSFRENDVRWERRR